MPSFENIVDPDQLASGATSRFETRQYIHIPEITPLQIDWKSEVHMRNQPMKIVYAYFVWFEVLYPSQSKGLRWRK